MFAQYETQIIIKCGNGNTYHLSAIVANSDEANKLGLQYATDLCN